MKKVIVKVQLPLLGDGTKALVYDRDREHVMQAPVTRQLIAAMEGEPKAFFEAEVDTEGLVYLGERVLWQGW